MDRLPFFGTLDWMWEAIEYLEEFPGVPCIVADIRPLAEPKREAYEYRADSDPCTSVCKPIFHDEDEKDWLRQKEPEKRAADTISDFLTLSSHEEHIFWINSANFALHTAGYWDKYIFSVAVVHISCGRYVSRLYLNRKSN